MDTFKAYLLIIGFVGALGFGGYWAATSLHQPVRVVNTEEIKVVAQTPVETIVDQTDQTSGEVAGQTDGEDSSDTSQTDTSASQGTHSDLIRRLQGLIDDNILMKEGSRGTRVGTVQEFLNLYNNTSNGIDNDYGPGTKSKVAAFQKAVGLSADGQAGPNTYKKMINWLESN